MKYKIFKFSFMAISLKILYDYKYKLSEYWKFPLKVKYSSFNNLRKFYVICFKQRQLRIPINFSA